MKTYPIAIFAYNRPKHLRNLLNSLENNRLSELSDVSIFIDKCDDEKIHNSILEVANKKRKFRSLCVTTHDENIGLKSNLIFGINEVLNNDDGIIVLEDDLFLDEYFLEFMNKSLNEYKESGDVYHAGLSRHGREAGAAWQAQAGQELSLHQQAGRHRHGCAAGDRRGRRGLHAGELSDVGRVRDHSLTGM